MRSLIKSKKIILALLVLLYPAFGQVLAQNESKADLIVQTGHTDAVGPVAFSSDGKYLVSGSWDGTVKLWETESGRELRTWSGFSRSTGYQKVNSVMFSPDGKKVAAGSSDGSLVLWPIASSGSEPLPKCIGSLTSVVFSPDGRFLAAACNAFEGKVEGDVTRFEISYKILRWDLTNGRELPHLTGHTLNIESLAFSPGSKTLISGSKDGKLKFWDFETGRELRSIQVEGDGVFALAISPDGRSVATGSYLQAGKQNSAQLWDIQTGDLIHRLEGLGGFVHSLAFSSDGKTIAVCYDNSKVGLWDVAQGTPSAKKINLESGNTRSVAYSSDGRYLALGLGHDDSIALIDAASGNVVRSFAKRSSDAYVLALSPDAGLLASDYDDNSIRLWSLGPGKMLRTLTGHTRGVNDMAFSPDGKFLASCSSDKTIKLWDIVSGTEIMSIAAHRYGVSAIAVSPDGQLLASVSSTTVKVWSIPTRAELLSIEMAPIRFQNPMVAPMLFEPRTLAFSKDGKRLAAADGSRSTRVFELAGGTETASLNGNEPTSGIADFEPEISRNLIRTGSKDGKFNFAVAENGKIVVSDARSKTILGRLVALGTDDWAFITPDGLFDSSPHGRSALHFVLDLESISLDQMKEAYYTPGLFQAIFKEKPLPKVRLFTRKDLFPEVEFSAKSASGERLNIKLKNRGGGIGHVQILINGKEFVGDARPAKFDPNIKETVLSVSLKGAPLVSKGENRIEVIARNAAGTLSNRGTARGADEFVSTRQTAAAPPNIYVIAGGISDYTGEQLKLNFAAKDAQDFAKAVEIGAVKMFGGDKSRVHIRLLTSSGENAGVKFDVPDAKVAYATKADFQRAFTDFKGATPDDIFIVYLAGHGISLNLSQNAAPGGTYLYLTQEATTTDRSVLSIEDSRKAMTVSGDELKELMKQNKALKQVLILDTCAAGSVSGSFVTKRDLDPNQRLALERLKDNTGFFVLMGSASNAVSYEASRYGQGLLTFSLLRGMQGASLSDEFAEVVPLFDYAAKTVGQLAAEIGGIQLPEIITPSRSRSFPIGQFSDAERRAISLESPKPILLRPNLQNSRLKFDNLKLAAILRAELRRTAFVGARGSAPIVFVDTDEMPDAVTPSGDYNLDGDQLTISVVLVKNNALLGSEIKLTGNVNEKESIIARLVSQILSATSGSKL